MCLGGCGASSSINNSYFSSASGDSSPCSFTVCKSESNICQIRLDFDTFVTEQPNTASNSPVSAVPTGELALPVCPPSADMLARFDETSHLEAAIY